MTPGEDILDGTGQRFPDRMANSLVVRRRLYTGQLPAGIPRIRAMQAAPKGR